ncbi:hypothetical protein DICPUDRAFT_152641 [Dictyostelium purpureum]|uniref:Purinergic receptor n=1 Tax=Dictyostelium purpureum TaxID=5786 RepID=F0ZLX2_DICPU|nr:uncharacterized protein DICPUDRAFT_152641 [Dictyostelium purpureum]EGC35062.1 hypothetical protein DICPUDRAFT_152641 [Dictyostelium purpureum]|eukprot:XP_003288430.1 hypothetical protein DICPUDRAFT_152641 [Dictyostelium purpureum]
MGLLSNLDWDSLFSYQTIKIVRIRDRRLGILHLSFLVAIILYILIFTILLQKKYLAIESPIGSIRTSLMAPQNRAGNLSYCSQTQPSFNGYENKPCRWWDEYLVLYPPSEESAMFISTRVTQENQTTVNNCDLSTPSCVYTTNSSIEFYVANVEDFTILLDHTLSAPTLGIQYNAFQLNGELLGPDGNPITLPAPNVVGIKNQPDILTLQGILTAAGIGSLDQQALANTSRSIRDDGILLLCFITYSNMYTYSTANYHYTYQFKLVQDTKFKVEEPVFLDNVIHRIILDRHGVRIIFIQTGQLGQFDFQTTLLTFVSGIGLVTVATFVVDFIAVRLLPQKERYTELKYQDSQVNIIDEDQQPTNNDSDDDDDDNIKKSLIDNDHYQRRPTNQNQ